MATIFRYRLARLRGQILGWGISLALLALLLAQFYSTIAEQTDQLEQLLESYPQEFMAFFGGAEAFGTPAGYLSVEFFSYMPLILGIFSVLVGSGMLVSDEEDGRLDLIMAHPVSRTELFWGRLGAFTLATILILLITWLGLAVPSELGAMPLSAAEMLLPFVTLFAVLMLFGTLALLLSLVLPSRRMAAMLSGVILVAAYFVPGLANINPDLDPLARFSPVHYYQGGEAINGLNLTWLAGMLAFAAGFALLAWWRFEQRDIRVGGEGGWQWGRLSRALPWRRTPEAREVAG
jgi:ABC-2 type transport system permease protein